MIETNKNIWDYYEHGHYVTVTTNVGWNKDGFAIMGRGIAKQAAIKVPQLPRIYGDYCKIYRESTPTLILHEYRMIMLPTKKFNKAAPHLSWQASSDFNYVKERLKEFKTLIDTIKTSKRIALPVPGTGNGQLPLKKVLILLREMFSEENRIIVCDYRL